MILRCDGDDGKPGTKQADGELLLWPAQHPDADAKTFDFHKKRPIKNGPAMTDSVHALIAARLGRADEAEEEFRASYRPFVRGPVSSFLRETEPRSVCLYHGLRGRLASGSLRLWRSGLHALGDNRESARRAA